MIKIYGMPSCPDCVAVDEQAKNDPRFEIIDLGAHVLHLKSFLKLRDTHPAFDAVKKHGGMGLLLPEHDAPACNLDGTGC